MALMELQVPWYSATRRALCSLGVCVCVCVCVCVEGCRSGSIFLPKWEEGRKEGEWKLEEG